MSAYEQTFESLMRYAHGPVVQQHSVSNCKVRQCSSVELKKDADTLKNNMSEANRAARAHLCSKIHDVDHELKMRSIYESLGICDAPITFNTRMDPCGNHVAYATMCSYLHLLYGDIIISTRYGLEQETHIGDMILVDSYQHVHGFLNNQAYIKDEVQITDLVDKFKRNKNTEVQLVYIAVCAGPVDDRKVHATLLVMWKDRKNIQAKTTTMVNVGIMCPLAATKLHYVTLLAYVRHHAGNDTYKFHPTLFPSSLAGKLQHIEGRYPKTSLDARGHCGIWVLILMEIIAQGVLRMKIEDRMSPTHGPFQFLETVLVMPNETPEKDLARLWRKLIMDYMFSRMVDMYAIARIMNIVRIKSYIRPILLPYITVLKLAPVVKGVSDYLPIFPAAVFRIAKNARNARLTPRKRKAN